MPLTVKENRAIGEQFVRHKDKKRSAMSQYVYSYTILTLMRISLHGKGKLLVKVSEIKDIKLNNLVLTHYMS
jgi:hypothetical protein